MTLTNCILFLYAGDHQMLNALVQTLINYWHGVDLNYAITRLVIISKLLFLIDCIYRKYRLY